MRWPWARNEARAQQDASYTDRVIGALEAGAAGTAANADGLAALEAAASLVGRCFASASADGDTWA